MAKPGAPPHRPRRRRVNPRDPRYPRGRFFRTVRWVFERFWIIIFIPYVPNVIRNIAALFANPNHTTPQALADAFYLGRLYQIWQDNPSEAAAVVGIVAALFGLAFLAWRDARRERAVLALREQLDKLVPDYGLKPMREVVPGQDFILAKYVPDVYLPRHEPDGRDAEAAARAVLRGVREHAPATTAPRATSPDAAPLGLLVVGRPTLGKTRFAWEAVRDTLGDATFVKWPHGGALPFDFTLVDGELVVLWLDNLQEYANEGEAPAITSLPQRFAASRLVVVATSRDRKDFDAVGERLSGLTGRLATVHLADLTHAEEDRLATDLERHGEYVDTERDGTPGALLLEVRAMREEEYPKLPEVAKAVLKAMALLRSARTYEYPAARVRQVARAIFGLADDRGAWTAGVDALVGRNFVRLGQQIDVEGLHRLEPVADVYLDRAVKDYPAQGARLTDDWPALQDALTLARDGDALRNLGYAYYYLERGLDATRPTDLRSAKRRSVACFRAALGASTPGTPAWADAQNNLGNGLRDQAGLATGEEQRRLLGEAVAAYRAALAASTPGTPAWAQTQYNLGVLYLVRAAGVAESGEIEGACADLTAAGECIRNALVVFASGSVTYYQQALEVQKDIEQARQELGCHDASE